jgi:hypothetical protein
MFLFELLAEQKIAEAVSRGELDGLPGQGRPLDLDDDPLVPEGLRVAYRILKNSGHIPPEVQALRDIAELERLVQRAEGDAPAQAKALRKLALLRTRIEAGYYEKVVTRLSRR